MLPRARHWALGNPTAPSSTRFRLTRVQVPRGCNYNWVRYRHIPNSLLYCSMRWRQLSLSSLAQLQLGCVLPSLPTPLMARSQNSTHQSCTSSPVSDKALFFFKPTVQRPSWNFSLLSLQSYLGSFRSHRLRTARMHILVVNVYWTKETGVTGEYQAILNRWPWFVIHLQGLGEIEDLWVAWENMASPTGPSAGAANPAPAPPFSDGKVLRENNGVSFLLTHATR